MSVIDVPGAAQRSTLTLLEAGVLLVDHVQLALATHDLAIRAALLDGRSDFHILCFASAVHAGGVMNDGLLVPEDDTPPRKVVGTHLHTHLVARKDSDVMHPHLAGNRGEDLMTVLQLDLEHRVAERFRDDSVLFDQ